MSLTVRESITTAKQYIQAMKQDAVPFERAILEQTKEWVPTINKYSSYGRTFGYGATLISGTLALGFGGRTVINLVEGHMGSYTINALFGLLFGFLAHDLGRCTRVVEVARNVMNKGLDMYTPYNDSKKKEVSIQLTTSQAAEFKRALTQIENDLNSIFLLPNILDRDFSWLFGSSKPEVPPAAGSSTTSNVEAQKQLLTEGDQDK